VESSHEVLAGLVERVTFHNPENGFCVLRIKARGHRDLVTIVGHAAMISAGEWLTASGESVIIIREGRALIAVGETRIEAEAGQIIFCPANVPHKFPQCRTRAAGHHRHSCER
jgi:mannose-6-phosphate isomerase-like protein (cupin superfamily)